MPTLGIKTKIIAKMSDIDAYKPLNPNNCFPKQSKKARQIFTYAKNSNVVIVSVPRWCITGRDELAGDIESPIVIDNPVDWRVSHHCRQSPSRIGMTSK